MLVFVGGGVSFVFYFFVVCFFGLFGLFLFVWVCFLRGVEVAGCLLFVCFVGGFPPVSRIAAIILSMRSNRSYQHTTHSRNQWLAHCAKDPHCLPKRIRNRLLVSAKESLLAGSVRNSR